MPIYIRKPFKIGPHLTCVLAIIEPNVSYFLRDYRYTIYYMWDKNFGYDLINKLGTPYFWKEPIWNCNGHHHPQEYGYCYHKFICKDENGFHETDADHIRNRRCKEKGFYLENQKWNDKTFLKDYSL